MTDVAAIRSKIKERIMIKLKTMLPTTNDNTMYKDYLLLQSPPPLAEMSRCRCIFVSSERRDKDKKILRPMYFVNGPFNVLVFKEFICKHDAGTMASLGCLKGAVSNPFVNRFVSSSFIYMSFVDLYYSLLDTRVVDQIKYFILYSTPQQARSLRLDFAELHWCPKEDVIVPRTDTNVDMIPVETLNDLHKMAIVKINNMMRFEIATLYGALAVTIAYIVYYFKIDIKTAFTESKSVYSAVKQIQNDHNDREDELFAKDARSRAFNESQDKDAYAKILQGNAAIEAEYAAAAPLSR
jgi:hypothetical protein